MNMIWSVFDEMFQTIPPADDPERAPDLLMPCRIAGAVEAIGSLMATPPGASTTFAQRLFAACAEGGVAAEVVHMSLALVLEHFVSQIDGDVVEAIGIFREHVIAPLVEALRQSSEPEPTWIVPAPTVDLRPLIDGVAPSLEDIVRMHLVLLGADLWRIGDDGVSGVDDAAGTDLAGDDRPTGATAPDDIEAHGVRLTGLAGIIPLAGPAPTGGIADGDPPVVVPTAADHAFATVLTWAMEFMDDTVPGLSRRFIAHALGTRIPRGDLPNHEVSDTSWS